MVPILTTVPVEKDGITRKICPWDVRRAEDACTEAYGGLGANKKKVVRFELTFTELRCDVFIVVARMYFRHRPESGEASIGLGGAMPFETGSRDETSPCCLSTNEVLASMQTFLRESWLDKLIYWLSSTWLARGG